MAHTHFTVPCDRAHVLRGEFRDAPKGLKLGGGGISKIYRLEIFTAQSIRIIFDPPPSLKIFPTDLPHFEIKFRNKKNIPKKMQKKIHCLYLCSY